MITRGWTSRSTSSVAQVRRASCTLMSGTPATAIRAWNDRTMFRGSTRRPYRMVNTKPSRSCQASPASRRDSSCGARASCSAVTQISGKGRQRGVRRFGLRIAVQRPAADPLELQPDRQLALAKIEVVPDEPEHLTPSQTEDQDEHARRIQRVRVPPGGLQESPRLLGGPGSPPLLPRRGQLDERRRIASDQLAGHRTAQGGPQSGPHVGNRAHRQRRLAAWCGVRRRWRRGWSSSAGTWRRSGRGSPPCGPTGVDRRSRRDRRAASRSGRRGRRGR